VKSGGMKRLTELREYQGEDQIVTSWDMSEILKQEEAPHVFNSKIPGLDKAIEGFEPGELIALSGPRKGGKTLLAQSLTKSFIEQDIKSLWFSYELTTRQFIDRWPDIPFFVMPQKLKAYALDWMRERILEALAKYGIGVVLIDHLHFLFDMAQSRNASLEIGQIIRWLKSLAVELNLVVFVLCHLQKISADKEPDDSHIRDSSFVGQESDTGLMIWRVRGSDNEAVLKVCYSRRTGAWEKHVPLIKVKGLLQEKETRDAWSTPEQ